ncbi:hypothetical protein ACJ73_03259 [Blastomyces percursus]|uniref:Uncharacterized protein n=1 Tax=Blastomyces percursus TaxID=1658174 RepID=A0A1J9QA99_9EURO|nr:hypothetical protein ACJ73_03259 [Blastomyces percursus]
MRPQPTLRGHDSARQRPCTHDGCQSDECVEGQRRLQIRKDKFAHVKLTPQPSELVVPCRILECPVKIQAELVKVNEMMDDLPERKGSILAMELRVYVGNVAAAYYVFFGVLWDGEAQVGSISVAEIDEEAYRSPKKNGVMQVAMADEKTCNDESKVGEHASSSCGFQDNHSLRDDVRNCWL